MSGGLFDGVEIISRYSEQDAVEDGILFDLVAKYPEFRDKWCNYITMNLLRSHGYFDKDKDGNEQINVPNLADLLNQATATMFRKVKSSNVIDTLYTGIKIESPDGYKFECWAELNGTSRFTLLLPEDH